MANNHFGITDTGKIRSNNEDAFIAEPVRDERYIIACVIDGVGGYHGGEIAAAIARNVILDKLMHADDPVSAMEDSFAEANKKIQVERKTTKENEQMACVVTLALADLAANKFYYTHVGDTRLYLLRDHTLVKISKDHSFVGFLEDNGRLTEEAAMKHPKRNEINKALGFEESIKVDDYVETGDSPFLPGDMLLLCSDGLTDMINGNQMTSILDSPKTLQEKGQALIKAANEAGGKDNITVVLVQNDKPQLKQEATKPVGTVNLKGDDTVAGKEVTLSNSRQQVVETRVKKKSGAVSILIILCIVLLAALAWLFYQGYHNKRVYQQQQSANIVVKKDRNAGEIALADSIKAGRNGEVFVLNPPDGQPVLITDFIPINNDSLHIIGNGVVLIGDSTFTGPAFTIGPSCRYILLDSLTLENFNIGILVQRSGLHLKNVQFRNVHVPLQHHLPLPEGVPVTGDMSQLSYGLDTLSK